MTTPPLDLPALRYIANAVEMFDDEWTALGTGPAGGDHWYICNDGESIASVSCQDGINEAEREPIARHIAAFDPPTVLALLDSVEGWMKRAEDASMARLEALARAEAAEKKVAAVEALASNGTFVATDVYGDLSAKQCGDGEDLLAVTLPDLRAALDVGA